MIRVIANGESRKVQAIFEISRGVEEFARSRPQGDEDLWGLANFQDPEGWPMSDNDIFQLRGFTVQTPENTMYINKVKPGLKLCWRACHPEQL